jgi:6-phosphogluconolactonase (cycloisomerase 2 family)
MRWALAFVVVGCGRLHFDAIASGDGAQSTGHVLYAAATKPDEVFAFAILADGSLSELPGSPVATKATTVTSLAADPAGQFLVVGGYPTTTQPPTLATFAIGASGLPSQIADTDYTASATQAVAFEPTGHYFYTGDYGDREYQFTLNRTTGTLTYDATTVTPSLGQFLAIDPSGRFLLTPGGGTSGITVSTIAGGTGALGAPVGYLPAGLDDAVSLAIDASSHHVYAANDSTCGLYAYAFNPASGVLATASLPGTPQTIQCFVSVTLAPSGRFVYAGTRATSGLGTYMMAVDATTGGLMLQPPTTGAANTAADGAVATLTFDPSGAFAYGISTDPEHGTYGAPPRIYGYAVDSTTGALSALPRSPFTASGDLAALAIVALP